MNELEKSVVVGAHFAGHGGRFGKLFALGLRDVKDIDDTKTNEQRLRLVVLLDRLLVALVLSPYHRSQNRNALLALLDEAAKLVPCANPCNVGCVGPMMRDGKDIAETVVVEPGHCGQISCESLALTLLKLLYQVLDVLSDDLLRSGLLVVAVLRRICAVRRGVVAVAVAVVTLEIHVFVLLFRRDRLSVFLTHGREARRRLAEKNERSARRWESGGKARQLPNAHHRLARSRAPNGRRRPA